MESSFSSPYWGSMLKLLTDGKLHSNSPWSALPGEECESVGVVTNLLSTSLPFLLYTQADSFSQIHSSSFPLNRQCKAMSHCDLNNSLRLDVWALSGWAASFLTVIDMVFCPVMSRTEGEFEKQRLDLKSWWSSLEGGYDLTENGLSLMVCELVQFCCCFQ